MDYKLRQRFNWWCPPELRRKCNMNNQPFFVENAYNPERSDFLRVVNSNIDKTVRCFRCEQTGHFYKQCAEIRIKSKKKLDRDFERLSSFIQRKTCENFPFFTLDDAEFRKATRTNSILHFQVNLLQTNQTQILKEKVKLESVVDLIKDQLKENRKSLRQEIEFLKQENKTLKTKLQKTISNNKDTLEEVDYLHNENNALSIIVRDLKNQIADLDVSELANKNKIKDLTTSCRKLETENNALRYDSCDCKIRNPSMSRQNQNKGQNVNHDPSRGRNPSRGRRRQYFY
ncbi:unnamed protein product [Mytilus coruscus]|uniref:CCHC-type domain-containing protein n=1 Tax=Mytilus coruscus TaxID=42192 RepID=A0A6J8A1X2_MYTCO|nr:unnamed protein product [Mytilus coruscus]